MHRTMGLLMKELGRLKPLNEDKGNSYLNLFHACSDDLLRNHQEVAFVNIATYRLQNNELFAVDYAKG
ncbi:hypothetical protein D5086_007563 [Populus alba]|uniref:Uncharacterized protein n=1 Tax=Populus alba TaxID=43335 RepID=A0ACC4CNT5_POPAL